MVSALNILISKQIHVMLCLLLSFYPAFVGTVFEVPLNHWELSLQYVISLGIWEQEGKGIVRIKPTPIVRYSYQLYCEPWLQYVFVLVSRFPDSQTILSASLQALLHCSYFE